MRPGSRLAALSDAPFALLLVTDSLQVLVRYPKQRRESVYPTGAATALDAVAPPAESALRRAPVHARSTVSAD